MKRRGLLFVHRGLVRVTRFFRKRVIRKRWPWPEEFFSRLEGHLYWKYQLWQ